MNSWNVSGEILKHGIKGTTYKTLWIQASLTTPHESVQSNKIFINFPMEQDTSTKKGRIAAAIIAKLEKNRFFFAQDLSVVAITVGTKKEDGTWDNKEVPGVRGNISNLSLSSERHPDLNIGCVSGTVGKYVCLESGVEKYLIEEKYRNPKTNEYKVRLIPIYNNNPLGKDITGRNVFISASLCGVTPDRESKTYGWLKKIIVL